MAQNQKDNQVASMIIQQIANASKDGDQGEEAIQMPELALRCAQFFHSLSQYCLYFYKNYNRQADIHKTKLIKKADKAPQGKHDKSKKSKHDDRKNRERGINEPEPPKKPLTAYIIYFQDKKPSFAEKFPTLSLSELTKLIAKDWKDLKDEEKKPYLDKAADDRKRYENQMKEFKRKYHQKEGDVIEEELKEEKKQSDAEIKASQVPIEIEEEINPQDLQNQVLIEEKSEKNKEISDEYGAENDEENDDDEQDGDQQDIKEDQQEEEEGQEQQDGDVENDASEPSNIEEE